MPDKRGGRGSKLPGDGKTAHQEAGSAADSLDRTAAPTTWHSPEAVQAILEASALLAENVALYFPTSSDPPRLLLAATRGESIPTPASSNRARGSLPELALISGQVQPASLLPGPLAIALPLKHGQSTIGVLFLDRGNGTAFSSSDVAAAQALATVVGPLLNFDQLYMTSSELALQEERNRIAREIHDGVSQSLALLILKMEIISRLADSDPTKMKAELRNVMSILELSVQELRRTLAQLLVTQP